MKLVFDYNERLWLNRNLKKRATVLSTNREALKLGAREIAIWLSLSKKFNDFDQPLDNGQNSEIPLNRNELRIMQTLVLDQIVNLTSKVIPAYEERLPKQPDLQSYLDAAIELRGGLVRLSTKIGGGLK